jgi:DNA-binding CsgD family transcriptional regulator/pimeloyl-ACP methyl ester carboxylesterase
MDRPTVQYATTKSGATVAFAIRGDGPPVVLPPYTVWTLDPPRPIPEASDLWQLARGAQLLAFNHVGVGLSQRTGYDFSLDGLVDELHTVVQAAGLRDFVLLASGCAGPPAIKYAVKYPEGIRHLILRETWASSAQPARKRLMMFGAAIEAGDWEAASQGYARLGWNLNGEAADAVAECIRSAIEPKTLLEYFRCVAEHDVHDLLGDVRVPTTVMRRAEPLSPLRLKDNPSDALARAIPGAQLWLSDDPPWDWTTYAALIDDGPQRNDSPDAGDSVSRAAMIVGGPMLDDPARDEIRSRNGESDDEIHVTPREEEVLALIASGDTNQEIASALAIVEGTVKRHVSNLLQKTGLKNRRQLMRFADRRRSGEALSPARR